MRGARVWLCLTTGTELRPAGATLGPGDVYEANGAMLSAQLREAGALVEVLAPVADDEAQHREAIEAGLEHDVLVTSGGVSVGSRTTSCGRSRPSSGWKRSSGASRFGRVSPCRSGAAATR